ncbi:MAG TPA: VCBS repeat-containing protein [Egibacteraceae bacterium]|nr:VCBS repeat-containing protein [Egibacteraceae bacterium]
MSDDPTRPLGPDDRTRPLAPQDETRPLNAMGAGGRLDDERASRARTAMALAAIAVLLLVVVLLLVNRGGDGDSTTVGSSPTETSTEDEPTDSPSPTPTETESPTEEPDEPREPTDTDAAEFSAAYRPQGAQAVQSATADLDGDGQNEVVFASIHSDSARIDIARWDGREYQIVYTGQGGGAERLDDFRVADYTGDGTREVVTVQSVGAQGQSLSIWGWNGQAFAPQRATGGCWNGSHTFGIIGASIERGRIRASCDGSPLPAAAWPSDVYVWDADGGGWVYDHTEE